jgi:hypothetical protein
MGTKVEIGEMEDCQGPGHRAGGVSRLEAFPRKPPSGC